MGVFDIAVATAPLILKKQLFYKIFSRKYILG